MNLIDEVYAAGKGGKPVSVAAIKGFAFAWLFPRTVIVVGSIISGLVLVAQTVILYRQMGVMEAQTELMRGQTAAAQLDRAEKLRLRIAANIDLISRLDNLAGAFMPNAFECSADCGSATLEDVLRELQVKGFAPHGRMATRFRFSEAESLTMKYYEWIQGMAARWNAVNGRNDLMPGAQLNCFVPKDVADQVHLNLQNILLMQPDAADWVAEGGRYQIVLSARAAGDIRDDAGPLLVADFLSMTRRIASAVQGGLRVASGLCAKKLATDQAALEAIEGVPVSGAMAASASQRKDR